MAIITGTPSGVGLEVDATSKAARVTIYDSAGFEVQAPPVGVYLLPVNVRQTAATAANSVVWAMRNGASRTLTVKQINVTVDFDGTLAALTTPRYGVQRFTIAAPTGGTALVPIKKRSTYSASTVADARFLDTGLTLGAMVFETDAMVFGVTASVTGGNSLRPFDFTVSGERHSGFELAPNEGLCIRLNTAAVIGVSLTGFVGWDER